MPPLLPLYHVGQYVYLVSAPDVGAAVIEDIRDIYMLGLEYKVCWLDGTTGEYWLPEVSLALA